jgi:hypothetical protein
MKGIGAGKSVAGFNRQRGDLERSSKSYEDEIERLSSALSEECSNSLRLVREKEEFRAIVDEARALLASGDDEGLIGFLRGS